MPRSTMPQLEAIAKLKPHQSKVTSLQAAMKVPAMMGASDSHTAAG